MAVVAVGAGRRRCGEGYDGAEGHGDPGGKADDRVRAHESPRVVDVAQDLRYHPWPAGYSPVTPIPILLQLVGQR
ncbi:hypothetical protein GCM10020358_67650 [Amorphoplanes nipponensis]